MKRACTPWQYCPGTRQLRPKKHRDQQGLLARRFPHATRVCRHTPVRQITNSDAYLVYTHAPLGARVFPHLNVGLTFGARILLYFSAAVKQNATPHTVVRVIAQWDRRFWENAEIDLGWHIVRKNVRRALRRASLKGILGTFSYGRTLRVKNPASPFFETL